MKSSFLTMQIINVIPAKYTFQKQTSTKYTSAKDGGTI
jgi:hypothetical protein